MDGKKESKERKRARRPPLQGTSYTNSELNAKLKRFPPLHDLMLSGHDDSILINPEQPAEIIGNYIGSGDKVCLKHGFCNYRGRFESVTPIILGMYYLIRKYRLTLIVESMKLRVSDNLDNIGLYGWSISEYERRRSISLIKMLFDSNVANFRNRATHLFQQRFGAWLANKPHLRVYLIPSNEHLYSWFRNECVILGVLRSSLADCRASAVEWSPITTGENTPTLNRIHRIVNPELVRSPKEKLFTQAGMFVTSIMVTFYGCSDVRVVYPRCNLEEDHVDVACFFGRVNLGELRPTVREARAVLKLCETDAGVHMSDDARYFLRILDEICGWSNHRHQLLGVCKEAVEAHVNKDVYSGYVGRLWHMV